MPEESTKLFWLRVKVGVHEDTSGVYHALDPHNNTFQSSVNLAKRWPEKFEEVGAPAVEQVAAKDKDEAIQRGEVEGQKQLRGENELSNFNIKELRDIARENNIQVPRTATKEELVQLLLEKV